MANDSGHSHWFHENLELLRLLLNVYPHPETRFRRFGADNPTVTALGLAVSLGQLQTARLLIDHGADIFATQWTHLDGAWPDFETDVFGLASKRGDIAMMRMLLDASRNMKGPSPMVYGLDQSLILAVAFGREEATKLLLNSGVAVSAADHFLRARGAGHRTLVERALAQQNLELHLTLVAAGASVDWSAVMDCFSFKLFHSIKQKDVQGAMSLLSLKAPPDDLYDDFPDTALGAAIGQGSRELIQLLKIAGVTAEGHRIPYIPNMETLSCLEALGFLPTILRNNGQMILTCAILRAKEDGLVEYLLSRGVDQQEMKLGPLESFDGWLDNLGLPECQSPLEAALTRRNMTLAQTLIHRGALATEKELNAIAPTAVGMAVLWGRTGIVRVLLNFGIDPRGLVYVTDPPDEGEEITNQGSGWWHRETEEVVPSVLEVAASKSDREILQLLLDSMNWTQEDKSRSLTASLFWRNYHLVSDLLAACAGVNQGMMERAVVSDKVNTELLPLQVAVNAGNVDMVKLLLRRGAKINQIEAGAGGKTASQIAAKTGNVDLLALLLEKGANVNQPAAENMGATALQFAAMGGHIEIACRLLDHGADINAPKSRKFGRTAMEGAAERGHIDMAAAYAQ
ncbi:Ankyrin repeat and KH domain-containing protein mask [Penicillium subrubescens]|uniref:Ankyrin repeat and KH domain-containing protein mask n=1 Tax=Penicillium subrubescens TaxID=1316194 RepID=A0A1Q5UMV8_9EURO|nr:Ankyrin repeat and KH domain-containing protein mask [Penicillium subrubescens]